MNDLASQIQRVVNRFANATDQSGFDNARVEGMSLLLAYSQEIVSALRERESLAAENRHLKSRVFVLEERNDRPRKTWR